MAVAYCCFMKLSFSFRGARHGLRATGKLARIAQQEQLLLTQSQYNGYSHAKRRKAEETICELQSPDETSTNNDLSDTKKQKKKKNKDSHEAEREASLPVHCEKSNTDSVTSEDVNYDFSRKSKKPKSMECDAGDSQEGIDETKKKKNKKKHKCNKMDVMQNILVENNTETIDISVKKVKKKKLKE